MTRGTRGRPVHVGRALGAALLLALYAGGPRVALAADPPAAAKADTSKQAQQLLDEGLVAIKLGQWEKARSFLLGAWRLQQHWRIAPHLANVELKLGRMRDAAEHLSFFLREGKSLDAGDRKQAETLLARARAKIGTVNVGGAPAGAEIRVDGELVGTAPLAGPIFVEPGTRRVEARAEGYATAERVVTLGPGQEGRVEVALAAVPRAGMTGEMGGRGKVGEEPGAGERTGPSRGAVTVLGTATVVAAAATAVFTGFFFAKQSESDGAFMALTANDGCRVHPQAGRCPSAVTGPESARLAFGRAAMWGGLATGALLVGTLTYVFIPRSQPGPVRAAAMVGPTGAGGMIAVSW